MPSLAIAIALAISLAAPAPPPDKPAVAASQLASLEWAFEHVLSTPNGPVAVNWASLSHDREHGETFVVAEGFVRVFDRSGMEVYRFGDDGGLGNVTRVVPLEDGELVALTMLDGVRAYVRCDFRGELRERFSLSGLPPGFTPFEPDQLVYRDGKLYFAERGSMRVVVTDLSGNHKQSFRLKDLVAAATPPDADRKPASSLDGFNVDSAGNILFTMSTMFAGARLTPGGQLRTFGSRGSTPGRFNIIGGIDSDPAGNVYVTDRLRSIVSVWDRELRYLGEFGYRGDAPSNLLTPFELAVGDGRIFVAQAGKRGVKVFRARVVEPNPRIAPPPPPPPAPPPPPVQRPRPKGMLG
jgi:hypothetical protein